MTKLVFYWIGIICLAVLLTLLGYTIRTAEYWFSIAVYVCLYISASLKE